MTSNSPTLSIDVDKKLHEKRPSSKYKIEQNSTNKILSVETDYQVNIFDFFLFCYIDIFRIQIIHKSKQESINK